MEGEFALGRVNLVQREMGWAQGPEWHFGVCGIGTMVKAQLWRCSCLRLAAENHDCKALNHLQSSQNQIHPCNCKIHGCTQRSYSPSDQILLPSTLEHGHNCCESVLWLVTRHFRFTHSLCYFLVTCIMACGRKTLSSYLGRMHCPRFDMTSKVFERWHSG